MARVSVGLLHAALAAQQAALAVVSPDGQVIAAASPARRLFDAVSAPAACRSGTLPNALVAFTAAVAREVSAREMEAQLMTSSGRAIRVRGTAYCEDGGVEVFVILSLEEVLRPWDMVVDAKHWHHLLTQSWPLSFMTGEWCEAERDVLFHVSNDAGARMMGLRGASDLCGRRASELGWSPEELTRWADEMKRTDEGGRCAVERETVDGSKSIRVCSGLLFWAPDGSGNFRFFNTVEDVTEARQSARQLNVWKFLFDKAPLGMGIARIIDDDKDILYETVNPLVAVMLEKLGGPRPLGGYRGSLMPPSADGATFLAHAIQCRNLGCSLDLEYTSESYVKAHWKTHYVPLGDNYFGWIAQDITKQKELELMLRKEGERLEQAVRERTRDLEAALQVKSQFLAVVSHELRTPISGILGSMELLSETAHLSEEHSTLLRIARTCGEQLSTVIDDILDFTKLQERKVELQAEEFGLRELLERVVEIASLSIRSKSMELLLAPTGHDIPDRIVADPARLRQIMLNLLSNAVKFTEFGEVRVSVRGTPVDGEARTTLSITVSDTGIGIPPHLHGKIFQPFSQVAANRYDVVLMDVMMPIKSGLEASEEIHRRVPADRRPYIVAVTASAFEEDKQRCLAAGMQEVLTKPVDRRKLARLLSEQTSIS